MGYGLNASSSQSTPIEQTNKEEKNKYSKKNSLLGCLSLFQRYSKDKLKARMMSGVDCEINGRSSAAVDGLQAYNPQQTKGRTAQLILQLSISFELLLGVARFLFWLVAYGALRS